MREDAGRHRADRRFIERCHELELKSLLLDSILDAVIVHTPDGELVYFNDAAARQRGYTRAEFQALDTWGWISPEWRPRMSERMATMARQGFLAPFEVANVGSDGGIVCAEVHPRMVTVGGERLCVAVVRDVTGRHEAEEHVRYMADHDMLTGLANRHLLQQRMERAFEASHDQGCPGMVYIDLDDFKPVNDLYGHAIGDRALQVVAKRIRASVREGDTVARLGGDEFGVLVVEVCAPNALDAVAGKLGRAIGALMSFEGVEVRITASIGYAAWEPGDTPDDLLRRADLDMYAKKKPE